MKSRKKFQNLYWTSLMLKQLRQHKDQRKMLKCRNSTKSRCKANKTKTLLFRKSQKTQCLNLFWKSLMISRFLKKMNLHSRRTLSLVSNNACLLVALVCLRSQNRANMTFLATTSIKWWWIMTISIRASHSCKTTQLPNDGINRVLKTFQLPNNGINRMLKKCQLTNNGINRMLKTTQLPNNGINRMLKTTQLPNDGIILMLLTCQLAKNGIPFHISPTTWTNHIRMKKNSKHLIKITIECCTLKRNRHSIKTKRIKTLRFKFKTSPISGTNHIRMKKNSKHLSKITIPDCTPTKSRC